MLWKSLKGSTASTYSRSGAKKPAAVRTLAIEPPPLGWTPMPRPWILRFTSALHDGQPVSRTAASSKEPALLAVPIRLRGETIGLIQLEDNSIQDRVWSEEEINSILAVADQVGLALENARLLEKTIRRADRERRVLEITSKIRSTNDPQSMINIAVQELQRSLNASRAQIILTSASESHEPDNGHPKTPGNGSGNPGLGEQG